MRLPLRVSQLLSACLVLSIVLATQLLHGQDSKVIPRSSNDRWMTEIADAYPAYGRPPVASGPLSRRA